MNPLTEAGIEPGKHLYHDTQLSINGPLEGNSCASCHLPEQGFASGLSGGLNVMPMPIWDGRNTFFGMGLLKEIQRRP